MHRFIQKNNKNMHETHTGITHKTKRIHNNAACNLTQNGHLSCKNVTNYVQTFHEPPIPRPCFSSLLAVGHRRVGTKLHPCKGIPNQADVSQKIVKTPSQVPTQTNIL
jgi:hypothetical protein